MRSARAGLRDEIAAAFPASNRERKGGLPAVPKLAKTKSHSG